MRLIKSLMVCVLLLILFCRSGYSQNCSIEVTTDILDASARQTDGSVVFQIDGRSLDSYRYVIFDLNAIREGNRDVKLTQSRASHLAAGKYEFLIVDRRQEKCSKEILVEIKERKDQK